jgi:hypothetical protein
MEIPIVEVIAPNGTKSLWEAHFPYSEAVAAVRKIIPPDYIAELSIRRRKQKLNGLLPGQVRKIEG